MFLKSITLKGFKSFPDRTRLEFGPGVSVVVGPNGSGKSNVTDAVLWALGEQSAVAVRGQSMQDVIFGGAPGRQAGKSAEVELVLDDGEGSLALGVPEISIVRRLDRSGEGEYRLAGARCRLVDVIELLSDTGLGKEMHSVISQGRVESIVTSKPRDRRLLIEEAAGLGKHRKRRRRAQLKLGHTQDNLDRALDIEREARSRLRPLKRQAEAAELHARLERQSLEVCWELSRDQLRDRLVALEQAQSEAGRARAGRAELERQLQSVAERREAAEEALAERSAKREELSRRCFTAQSAAERLAYRAEAVRAGADATEGRLARGRELLASLQNMVDGDLPERAAEERISALAAQLAALDRDREGELARQLTELQQQLAAASAQRSQADAEAELSRSARQHSEARVEPARHAAREAEREVDSARREIARVGAELGAVDEFLRSQQPSPGGAPTLADELQVDPGYELAFAAALDGRLRAAVVSDRAGASTLLDRAGDDGGRTLVAASPVVPIALAPGELTVPPVPGAERMIDHVRGDGDAVALVRALLVDAWIVDSVQEIPESFRGVAVTRTGRAWSGSTRELRQTPAVGEERVLAERNRREELMRVSERAVEAELTAISTLERATVELARLDAEREHTIAADRAAVQQCDEIAERERRIAALIELRRAAPDEGSNAGRRAGVMAELSAERGALERSQRERADRAAQIERLRAAAARDEAFRPAVLSLIEALACAAGAIADQRASFELALSADREAGEHVAAELRRCAQQEATFHARLHAENESLTALEVSAQRARDQAADAEEELRGLSARLRLEAAPASERLSSEERESLIGRAQRLARRREQLGPVNPLAQEEHAAALEHVEELERQRSDLEIALRELEKLIADTDRQIRETFQQTFAAAAANFEELAAQLFPGGRGQLRLVTEPGALAQRALGPGRALGGQASSAGATDPQSPDGEVTEELEGSVEDGVEIEITPAGKEMKRLSLLSGGEKSLTALAFLFSVFLAKPCPFYILDEVEAALDDLNIDRFLGLLRQYSKRAQFIVVTHQRRTMEAADSLYGVSMGGDGISKVISRRLPAEAAA